MKEQTEFFHLQISNSNNFKAANVGASQSQVRC